MIHINVKFGGTDQIARFVGIMNKYDFNADIKCGSRIVDAKSIMGVLTLAAFKTAELILHTTECERLLEEINALQIEQAPGF